MLLNAAKFQGYSFYRFWVIKGKPTGGGVKLPPPLHDPTQIRVNSLKRLKCFLGFEERKVLINSFILSSFNYCTLVWPILANSLFKVENLQKWALRFLLNDYSSSHEQLLKIPGKTTINVSNYRTFCIEIFKTLNNINPGPILKFKGSARHVQKRHPTVYFKIDNNSK